MFFGHLPAGYLLTRGILSLARRTATSPSAPTPRVGRRERSLLALGLLVSVAPDADLLWFYTFGRMQRVHHDYWPHLPVTWLALLVVGLGLSALRRRRAWFLTTVVVTANGLFHLALDTIVGGIRWSWPVGEAAFRLFHVRDEQGWWVLNFLLHPSLALEFAVLLAAALALRVDLQRGVLSMTGGGGRSVAGTEGDRGLLADDGGPLADPPIGDEPVQDVGILPGETLRDGG